MDSALPLLDFRDRVPDITDLGLMVSSVGTKLGRRELLRGV